VVDDEDDIRASLRGVLGDEGFRVLEAEDGRRVLELVRAERPALVLLDVWMPDIDGIELLRRLQEEPDRPQVVMISGHGNIETAVQATKLGAFDFIEKPFSIEALLSAVGRALEHREQAASPNKSPVRVRQLLEAAGADRPVPARTLRRPVIASGHGLHSGIKSGLILGPQPAGRGIVFANVTSGASVPAHLDYVDSTGYATTLHSGGMTVSTVEHLLASLHSYGITNALIKVQSEVPAMDGSALEFCALIEHAGVEEQSGGVEPIVVRERLRVGGNGSGDEEISIEPADGLSIHYTLEYPPPVGRQEYTYIHASGESFKSEIAPARTFGFMRDMKALAAMGLASGGRLDNFILIDDQRVVNTDLRFPNELARHKILDILGDIYLLGRPLRGHIRAHKTGHSDNIALLRVIRSACT
jgi:UDP-3-O-acyl N-acetylglucosamine deacetylase